jgi:2-keto-3-deoxy-6-phosphogluconate aldolase
VPAPRNLTASPTREEPSHPTAILAIICISYFMVILDNSIIFTGLPRIEVGVAATPGDASAIAALVERVTTALTGAGVMLAVALVLVAVVAGRRPSVRHGRPAARPVAAPPVTGAVAELRA